jgi:hypothetical protein
VLSRRFGRLGLGVIVLVVLLLSLSCYVGIVHAAEPSLTDIFDYFGFPNVVETTLETFPAGTYNLTLYAEFAGYSDENELSYYAANTSIFNVILEGSEGGSGYISPPINKTFTANYEFGLSMLSPGPHRYFTENSRNPDGEIHAKVYRNLDDPEMLLVGFENMYGAGDRDYNDMVFSIQLRFYLSVFSPYDTPGGEGWYYNGTYAYASLVDGVVDHGNLTRRMFTHWSGDTSGTNYSKSEPIYMNQNRTAVANWKTQYSLTLTTDPLGVATPTGEGWYDEGEYASISTEELVNMVANSSRYKFNGWTTPNMSEITDPSSSSTTVKVDEVKTVTANYVIQYSITFDQTGLDSTAVGTIVTVNGSPKTFSNLPFSIWVNEGSQATYTYENTVASTSSGKRFVLTDVTGPTSPITATGQVNVTGDYDVQYLLSVHTSGLGIYTTNIYNSTDVLGIATDTTPYQEWFNEGSLIQLDIDSPIIDGSSTLVFTNWSGDASGSSRPFPVTLNSSKDITANYKTGYLITFNQTGLDGTADSIVVTVNGVPKTFSNLPFGFWADESDTIIYLYNSTVSSTEAGKRFNLTGVAGPASPIIVTGPITVVGDYKTQYEITFNQSGVDTDYTEIVITIDGHNYDVANLPVFFWWDENSVHNFVFHSPLIVAQDVKQYLWTSTIGLSTSQSDSITVSTSGSVTGDYKTQYYLAVQTDPPDITTILGEDWYNFCETVELTAPTVAGYEFLNWNVDGDPVSGNPIQVYMNESHIATAYYLPLLSVSISPPTTKIKVGESVTFTSTVSGGQPPYNYQWYLNKSSVSGETNPEYTFEPTSKGMYIIYLNVTDNLGKTVKSNEASVTVAPPLIVSIFPTQETIYVGESVEFTSNVEGGYPHYDYQWYRDNKAVSGATHDTWTFTPTERGLYFVYLEVTDANNNVVPSEPSRITVKEGPEGGYSISLTKQTPAFHTAAYVALTALLGIALTITRRKRK